MRLSCDVIISILFYTFYSPSLLLVALLAPLQLSMSSTPFSNEYRSLPFPSPVWLNSAIISASCFFSCSDWAPYPYRPRSVQIGLNQSRNNKKQFTAQLSLLFVLNPQPLQKWSSKNLCKWSTTTSIVVLRDFAIWNALMHAVTMQVC